MGIVQHMEYTKPNYFPLRQVSYLAFWQVFSSQASTAPLYLNRERPQNFWLRLTFNSICQNLTITPSLLLAFFFLAQIMLKSCIRFGLLIASALAKHIFPTATILSVVVFSFIFLQVIHLLPLIHSLHDSAFMCMRGGI